ncbi:MAG: hypothetical protein ABI693_19640 [Bryobacteraceae bacterium]
MNPIGRLTEYVTKPQAINSFPEYLAALLWLVLPAFLLLWMVAVLMWLLFPASRERYGASVAIRLAFSWAVFWAGAAVVLDVVILLVFDRVPGWSAVTPMATLTIIGLVFAFVLWNSVRGELGGSRRLLRQAEQEGARR